MSDVMLLGATSVGLGLYVLYLLAKQKALATVMYVTIGAVHDGHVTIEKINGRYVVKPTPKTLQCKDSQPQ